MQKKNITKQIDIQSRPNNTKTIDKIFLQSRIRNFWQDISSNKIVNNHLMDMLKQNQLMKLV